MEYNFLCNPWKCWNTCHKNSYHKSKNKSQSLFYKENKSRLGDPLKTRSNLEHGSFPSAGLILISDSTNNANEINGGAYVPLAAV